MIDTIVLRVHDLRKYKNLIDVLQKQTAASQTKVKTISEVDSEGNTILKRVREVDVTVFGDSGNHLVLNHRSTRRIASSHYNIAYMVAWEKDYLEINLSIPKYLYGTNVLQFVPYFDQSSLNIYRMLMEFCQKFIKDWTTVQEISPYDVEINRIDFCYNQIFSNERDCRVYLNQIKQKITSMYRKDMNNNIPAYSNSTTYKTKRFSFKVYHKGDEFAKNDRKKLLNLQDKEKVFIPYNLTDLQAIADKTLRYESTYRNSFINYLFSRWCFNPESKTLHHYQYLFGALRIDGLSVQEVNAKKFMLASEYDAFENLRKSRKNTYLETFINNKFITFTFEVFDLLFNHFWKLVKEQQVHSTISFENVQRMVELYKKEIEVDNRLTGRQKLGVRVDRILYWLQKTKDTDLREYRKSGEISQRQYFRIKALLDRFNLSTRNPDTNLVTPGIDYSLYKHYFSQYHSK